MGKCTPSGEEAGWSDWATGSPAGAARTMAQAGSPGSAAGEGAERCACPGATIGMVDAPSSSQNDGGAIGARRSAISAACNVGGAANNVAARSSQNGAGAAPAVRASRHKATASSEPKAMRQTIRRIRPACWPESAKRARVSHYAWRARSCRFSTRSLAARGLHALPGGAGHAGEPIANAPALVFATRSHAASEPLPSPLPRAASGPSQAGLVVDSQHRRRSHYCGVASKCPSVQVPTRRGRNGTARPHTLNARALISVRPNMFVTKPTSMTPSRRLPPKPVWSPLTPRPLCG
jgi:hypothetical protein